MATRQEFIQMLKDRGATKEEAAEALKLKKEQGTPFDDSVKTDVVIDGSETIDLNIPVTDAGAGRREPLPEGGGPGDFIKSFLPNIGKDVDIPGGDVVKEAGNVALSTLDFLDTPKRALGTLRGGDITDPKSSLLQKEAEPFLDLDVRISQLKEQIKNVPDRDQLNLFQKILSPNPEAAKGIMKKLLREAEDRKKAGKGPTVMDMITGEFLNEAPTLFIGSLGKGAKKMAEILIKGRGTFLNRSFAKMSELTEEAFDFIKDKGQAGVDQLNKAKGTFDKIGQELKTLLFDSPSSSFPESKIINESLSKMGDVPLEKTIKEIEKQIDLIPLKENQSNVVGTLEKLRRDIGEARNIQGSVRNLTGEVIQEAQFTSPSSRFVPGSIIQEGKTLKGGSRKASVNEGATDIMGQPIDEEGIVRARSSTSSKRMTTPEQKIPEIKTEGTRFDFPSQQTQKEIRTEGTRIETPGKEILSKTSDANLFKRRQRALDDIVNWKATGANITDKALKSIRKVMSDELFDVAKKTKNPEFIKATNDLSKKLTAIEEMKVNMGTNFETFTENLFNKGKSKTIKGLTEIEKLFGVKFKDRAMIANFAKKLKDSDFVEGRLKVPRGQIDVIHPVRSVGALFDPEQLFKLSNFIDVVVGGVGSIADIGELGLNAAQMGALANMLKSQLAQEGQ